MIGLEASLFSFVLYVVLSRLHDKIDNKMILKHYIFSSGEMVLVYILRYIEFWFPLVLVSKMFVFIQVWERVFPSPSTEGVGFFSPSPQKW